VEDAFWSVSSTKPHVQICKSITWTQRLNTPLSSMHHILFGYFC